MSTVTIKSLLKALFLFLILVTLWMCSGLHGWHLALVQRQNNFVHVPVPVYECTGFSCWHMSDASETPHGTFLWGWQVHQEFSGSIPVLWNVSCRPSTAPDVTGGIGAIFRQIILVLSILRGAILLYRCCCGAGSVLRVSSVTFHPYIRGNKYK